MTRIVLSATELREANGLFGAVANELQDSANSLQRAPLDSLPPQYMGEAESRLRLGAHRLGLLAERLDGEGKGLLRRAKRVELDLARPPACFVLPRKRPMLQSRVKLSAQEQKLVFQLGGRYGIVFAPRLGSKGDKGGGKIRLGPGQLGALGPAFAAGGAAASKLGSQAGKLKRTADVVRAAEQAAARLARLRTSIHYGGPDKLGRPTGVVARLTREHIGTGSRASWRIRPPGFQGNVVGHARGHLLARNLGGNGSDRRNIVTLFQTRANHPEMSNFERQVRTALLSGQTVIYRATPIYRGSSPVPREIRLHARSSAGLKIQTKIVNRRGRG